MWHVEKWCGRLFTIDDVYIYREVVKEYIRNIMCMLYRKIIIVLDTYTTTSMKLHHRAEEILIRSLGVSLYNTEIYI